MNFYANDENRQVVPRWRLSINPSAVAESRIQVAPKQSMLSDDVEGTELRRELEATNSPSVLADILGAAIAINEMELAREASDRLRKHEEGSGRVLDRVVRAVGAGKRLEDFIEREEGSSLFADLCRPFRAQIHAAKRLLMLNPLDALTWLDLAWFYASSGHREQAMRSGRVAKELEPSNRIVARAFSRLCLHYGEGDSGFRHLLHTGGVGHDPWITAAAVAVGDVIGAKSVPLRQARKLIKADRHSPLELSELRASVSKIESASGAAKSARRLLSTALIDPTENVVAQAAWASRRDFQNFPELDHIASMSNEAIAWDHYEGARFAEAFIAAEQWASLQPFSAEPYALALQVAFFEPKMRDRGLALAEVAIISNPGEAMVYNNSACLLAFKGNIEAARSRLSIAMRHADQTATKATIMATDGLIDICADDVEQGDIKYMDSILYAYDHGHRRLSNRAMLHWGYARILNGYEVPDNLQEAIKKVRDIGGLDIAGRTILEAISQNYPHLAPKE